MVFKCTFSKTVKSIVKKKIHSPYCALVSAPSRAVCLDVLVLGQCPVNSTIHLSYLSSASLTPNLSLLGTPTALGQAMCILLLGVLQTA